MEHGNLCGAVFLDLSKAFDIVDHCFLLAKLSSLGLSPYAVQWFQSYLSDRKQRTSWGKEIPDPLPITYGVPPGSILGPLLFLVYINGLPTVLSITVAYPFMGTTLFSCATPLTYKI